MNCHRFAALRGPTLLVALGLLGVGSAGCGGAPAESVPIDTERSGTIKLALELGGISIDAVAYTITGPNAFTRSGTIDTSASTTISAAIGGIPAGDGYTLTLGATSTDGQATCAGASPPFTVTAGTTTVVSIELACQRPGTKGSVLISGTVDQCPRIDNFMAVPAQAYVGESIDLTSAGHDADHGPAALSYQWTTTGGSLSGADTTDPRLTCTEPGTIGVTLTLSDGQCAETASFEVTCRCQPLTTCPEGQTCGVAPDGCGGTIDCGTCSMGTPIALTSAENGLKALAVDATSVYFTTADSVRKIPLNGGAAVTLASAQLNPSGIAVDATNVYWAITGRVRGSVFKMPLAGGTPVTLATSQATPMGLALDGANVYWTNYDAGAVMKLPINGGTPLALATTTGFPWGIAVAGGNVFWTDQTSALSVPASGGAPVRLTPDTGTSIAVDGANVYFITNAGEVKAVPMIGGTPVTLAVVPPSALFENRWIATDGTNVYWTADAGGTVMKVPVQGGAPTTLASTQATPQAIAVDATSVYWNNFADGTVMKLTPK